MMRQLWLLVWILLLLGGWWIRWMFSGVAIAVGAGINVYLLGHTVCLDCVPPLAAINHVAAWLLLGGIVVLAGAALVRSPRWVLVWLSPALVAFGVWYGPAFLPRPQPQPQGVVLRVATYNTLGQASDFWVVYDTVMRYPVDVLVLQEESAALNYLISTNLRDRYPYQVMDRDPGGWSIGIGLYSRYPITAVQRHVEGELRPTFKPQPDYIRAEIDVAGQTMVVYGFHASVPNTRGLLDYDEWYTQYSTEAMVGVVKGETLPTLVLCDCNTTPRARPYQQWDAVLDDAFVGAGVGLGNTYLGSASAWWQIPLLRIDHVWHSREFVPLSAAVIHTARTSDHLPLLVTLDLRD